MMNPGTSMVGGLLTEPVVIELVLSLIVTILIFWAVRRLLKIANRLDKRRALREFVRGMDHYLRGEFDRAETELAKVLERDPENVEARIALGDALRALGRAAEAHRQHYHVQKVFGHDLPRNDLSLGRDFLALGEHEEAIPALERALAAGVGDGGAYRELRDACLAAGRHEQAIQVGRAVLDRAADDKTREEARRTLGRALTLAGTAELDRGAVREAIALLEEAIAITPELVQARMELVRARLQGGGEKAGALEFSRALSDMRRLADGGEIVFEPIVGGAAPEHLADAGHEAIPATDGEPARIGTRDPALLPAPEASSASTLPVSYGTSEVVARREAATPALPEDVLAPEDVGPLLDRAARVFCEECGKTARDWTERCAGCGAYGTMRPRETSRLKPIPDPRALLAEIEQSRTYVKKLCADLVAGQQDAAEPLARVGREAVPVIFHEALSASDVRPLVLCLARMGTGIVPDLLESWRRARTVLKRKVFGEKARRRSADGIVVSVLSRMGRDVEPMLRDLLERSESEVRLLVLETMLRLRMLDLVEESRLLFSAAEFVGRLNEIESGVFRNIVEAAAPDSHLVRIVFPDRTLRHDAALVEALVLSGDREKVAGIIRARGFSSDVVTALLPHAEDPGLREILFELIGDFGPAAADHLLTAVVDPDLSPAIRADVAALLVRFGSMNVEKLLDGAADQPGGIKQSVVEMLAGLGDGVVSELKGAYVAGGWLSRIGLGRDKIQSRRRIILGALTMLATERAAMALREIRMRETDAALRREAENALKTVEEG
jgi:lipopolysaccharide biosynthesis regulator YciM